MNQYSPEEKLYKLLPAIYQLRDQCQGEPLRALLAIAAKELQILEEDIDSLYENWFIETCDEWVVPYIGDLLDVQELYAQSNVYGQQQRRAYVANTIAYRRRKGTTPILEQLTRDVTGWQARAVEFFQRLATTQNLNHLRLSRQRGEVQQFNNTTVNLRQSGTPEFLGTPFEQQVAYSVDIRSITNQQGLYNLPNIGLYIWRLQSYPLERVTAKAKEGYYTFNPLGYDQFPLFNQPQTETDIVNLAEEINVPAPLRRLPLEKELQQRREQLLAGNIPNGISYFDADPVIQIFINNQSEPIPPEEILITDLADTEENQVNSDDNNNEIFPRKTVKVDPELGKLAFVDGIEPYQVEVSYFYGFSGDIGGGSYERSLTNTNTLQSPLVWKINKSTAGEANPITSAVESWNQTVSAWHNLSQKNYLYLAKISVTSKAKNIRISDPVAEENSQFKPGIIRGLQVTPRLNDHEVNITPGSAVDNQGRLIKLDLCETYDLQGYFNSQGKLQQSKYLLVISYKHNLEDDSYQINLLPEAANNTFLPGRFIILACLDLDENNNLKNLLPSDELRLQFSPGIVNGLQVKQSPGKLQLVITAGKAVDKQGRAFELKTNTIIHCHSYLGKEAVVAISSDKKLGWRNSEIKLTQKTELNKDSNKFNLVLANVYIPALGKVNLVRCAYTDSSLSVEVSQNDMIITVEAGCITNSQGQEIKLWENCQIDLKAYLSNHKLWWQNQLSNQKVDGFSTTLCLFLSPAANQKFKQIGLVPVEPQGTDLGEIIIQDNRTYVGDINIIIPAEKQLKIISTNGSCPHIQGSISVQGITSYDRTPGELILTGLLVEGSLEILPGNLRNLEINHCTFVPNKGGLSVAKEEVTEEEISDIEDSTDNSLSLVAIAFYFLHIIRTLLAGETSEKNISMLLKIVIKQIQLVYAQILGLTSPPPTFSPLPSPFPFASSILDNSQLTIKIYRSICGSLNLAETVPKLLIEDSIIDGGKSSAIKAPGTAVDCLNTSTVFGTTSVRSVEASESIFTGRINALRKQIGCLRFCYVPDGSQTPRRYLCQPDLALAEELDLDKLPPAITCLTIIDSQLSQLLAGTAGKGVLSYETDGNTKEIQWKSSNEGLTNLNITALLYKKPYIFAGTMGGSIFRREENSNNWQEINYNKNTEIRTGKGTISSAGNMVKISDGNKFTDVSENHVIIAAGQSRIVTTTDSDSNQFLFVNAPFEPSLNNTSFSISSLKPNTDITAFAANDKNIFAATAGSGVFRSCDDGETWNAINIGLTNLDVTTLEVGTEGEVFAGTRGGGIFRSLNQGKEWQKINAGLTNLDITALAVNGSEFIFAGTSRGGVFRFNSNSTIWTAMNKGLTNLDVTAMAISSQNLLIVGTVGGEIFYCEDHGENWQSTAVSLSNTDIQEIIFDTDNQQNLYASTTVGHILFGNISDSQNQDSEITWRSINRGLINIEEKLRIISTVQPRFTSSKYGDPGYAQLSNNCAKEICTGAEDGSEMGVFSYLKQPQRRANLEASLKEYLRFGLEVGIFYET